MKFVMTFSSWSPIMLIIGRFKKINKTFTKINRKMKNDGAKDHFHSLMQPSREAETSRPDLFSQTRSVMVFLCDGEMSCGSQLL